MKSLLFIILSLFFLFISCSKPKPVGVISQEKMSNLLTDVYLLDGYLNSLPIDSARAMMPVLYQDIFDKFNIDSATFMANIDYYYGNPVELDKISEPIKTTLTKYEKEAQRVDSIRQVVIRDSINRVNNWQREIQEARDLILQFHSDSTDYTFALNNNSFFGRVAVAVFRHELVAPVPTEPVPPVEDKPEVSMTSDTLVRPTLEGADSIPKVDIPDQERRNKLERRRQIIK